METENLYGSTFQAERGWQLEECVCYGEVGGGGALCVRFQLKPVYNCAANIFRFGYHLSWYNHAFTLQMITTCLAAEESSVYFVISKIQYSVHLQKRKVEEKSLIIYI